MFTGFPKEGVSWFQSLAVAQNREWFQAHKAGYEQLWLSPMKALLDELPAGLTKVYRRALGVPKVFRLNRDVRFSKDKSPYKTHIAALIPFEGAAPMEGPAALYVGLGLTDVVAFGFYMLDPPSLKRMRQRIVDGRTGRELQRRVDLAQRKGLKLGGHEQLKRAPVGFDAEHPRIELLKHKGLTLTRTDIPKGARFTKAFKPWLLEQAKNAAPVIQWGFQAQLSATLISP
jgi:uncharacterized protein (TIGR02453 family)